MAKLEVSKDNATDTMRHQITRETGLAEATVIDLLNKGWTYIKEIYQIAKWVEPSYQRVVKQLPGMESRG